MVAKQVHGPIPTLTPELDDLPKVCSYCTSRALASRPPLGREMYGQLACLRCGTVAAFLRLLPSVEARRDPLPIEEPAERIVRYTVRRAYGWRRLPECGQRCNGSSGCSPLDHQEYGERVGEARARAEASRLTGASFTGLIQTGPIAVDRLGRVVWVNGQVVWLTGFPLRALLVLAANLGRAVSYREVVEQCWSAERADEWAAAGKPHHGLRVTMGRLRTTLGPGGALIATAFDYGYRLEAIPYTGPADLPPSLFDERRPRWARQYDACLDCGTTERAHKALGLCITCHNRRRRKGRPAGRPRKDPTT